ncbi:MAG: BON domain-containing protein [Gammaproteobacteria bacterium]
MALVLCVAIAGCAFSVTPGKSGGQAEWIGHYQQEQANEKDQNRDTALRIRDALAADPVLRKLDLNIFVDRGSVRLCGRFPDATTRQRAVAVVEQVQGVESVTTHCQ